MHEPVEQDSPTEMPPGDEVEVAAEVAPPRPRRRGRIVIIALSVALAVALGFLTFYLIQLNSAAALIKEQNQQLDEQRDLIDKKETFGLAMLGLLKTAHEFDGSLMASLVPVAQYQTVANLAWTHRWKPDALDRDIIKVQTAQTDLDYLLAAAATEAATNRTASTYESVIDSLGGGFVTSLMDNPDALCESDVLACVLYDDPYTVHFDAADAAHPSMNDFIRTGVAYHEFAHVLQMTNPGPTAEAEKAFGGDDETMADCFALTYLDGWTLDHRVYVSDYEYWDVSIGYGYTCDDNQKQVVRDWYAKLGPEIGSISQAG